MCSMFAHYGMYTTAMVYESKDYGGCLSSNEKRKVSYEFFSTFEQQYHNMKAENNEDTSERSAERNTIIIVAFFNGGPTACQEDILPSVYSLF